MKLNRAAQAGRTYPEGMRRMQAFYAHYPQFRDVEFAVCGLEVVIFCQRDCDELREACELYGLTIRIDAPLMAAHGGKVAETADSSCGPHDRVRGRSRRNRLSGAHSRRQRRGPLARDGLKGDSWLWRQRSTSEG